MHTRFLLLIITAALLFISCQDDPTSLGKDLIDNPVELDVIDSNTDSLFQYSGSYRVGDTLISYTSANARLLGRYEDISATTLIRFGFILPDSVVDSYEDGRLKINSSSIELPVVYSFGDEQSTFNFSLYKILNEWGPSGFDADSLADITYDSSIDYAGDKVITDSLITINFDASLTLDWISALIDSSTTNYGVIFQPQATGSKILGLRSYFASISDETPLLKVIVEDEGNYIDTVTAYPVLNTHVVEGTFPEPPEDRILLQSGLLGRGKLFFDLSTIPEGVNINKAELTLTVDSVNSVLGSTITDSIRVNLFEDSTSLEYSNIRLARLKRSEYTYQGDISGIVQNIVLGTDNQGFGLRLSSELSGLDRIYIYNSSYPDPALKPKLLIYYSKIGL